MKHAAVAYIEREDRRILTVWNKRYGGFALPGGMTEMIDASLKDAMVRETREETSVEVLEATDAVFAEAHAFSMDPNRASVVHIFRVLRWEGEPREMEEACPVTWLTREQYLNWTCFPAFYANVFNKIEAGHAATHVSTSVLDARVQAGEFEDPPIRSGTFDPALIGHEPKPAICLTCDRPFNEHKPASKTPDACMHFRARFQ